jgi:creatinine amidohydrolase
MLLAIKPEAVQMDRACTDYGHATEGKPNVFVPPTIFDPDPTSGIDYSATGVRGDPTLATSAKGHAILEAMTTDLVTGLKAAFPSALP